MVKTLIRNISLKFRKFRFNKKKIDQTVTIISNNCTGGTMYNDLGLQFLSPTINLYFGEDGSFYNFLTNLKKYCENGHLIKTDKKECKKGFPNSPIGLLKCDGLPDIEIHFLHYNDFDSAKNKWIERCKRINYEK